MRVPRVLRELAGTCAFSLTFALLLTNCVIVNAVIPSGSMTPTINEGERVVAIRTHLRGDRINHQDIIVFYKDIFGSGVQDYYIKRVIGCPGDNITIRAGQVSVNDTVLSEPYIEFPSTENAEFKVPPESYFVLGDNRAASFDSRMWSTPYVHKSEVRGIASFKYFPTFEWIN